MTAEQQKPGEDHHPSGAMLFLRIVLLLFVLPTALILLAKFLLGS